MENSVFGRLHAEIMPLYDNKAKAIQFNISTYACLIEIMKKTNVFSPTDRWRRTI